MRDSPIHRVERTRVWNSTSGLHGGAYGSRDTARRTVDAHRTSSSTGQTTQEHWSSAGAQSQGTDGDLVCADHGHPLGVFAPGNGMRLRNDLLAPITGLAHQGRVAKGVRGAVGSIAPSRPNRLVAGGGGLLERARRFWGAQTGPNPTDRRKLGTKHHVITDGHGIPLAFTVTGANRHDVTQLIALVDAIPPVRGKQGRPKQRPHFIVGDRAYHSAAHEAKLTKRRIKAFIAHRNCEHGSGLGILRWVVERTISWLHQFRRLRVRYERRLDIHEAFLALACICICFHHIVRIEGFC